MYVHGGRKKFFWKGIRETELVLEINATLSGMDVYYTVPEQDPQNTCRAVEFLLEAVLLLKLIDGL